MKLKQVITTLGIILCLGFMQNANSQSNVYTTSGPEIIFSWGELKYTDAFKTAYHRLQSLSTLCVSPYFFISSSFFTLT